MQVGPDPGVERGQARRLRDRRAQLVRPQGDAIAVAGLLEAHDPRDAHGGAGHVELEGEAAADGGGDAEEVLAEGAGLEQQVALALQRPPVGGAVDHQHAP